MIVPLPSKTTMSCEISAVIIDYSTDKHNTNH